MTYQGWKVKEHGDQFTGVDPNSKQTLTHRDIWILRRHIDAITGVAPSNQVLAIVHHTGVDPDDVQPMGNDQFSSDGKVFLVLSTEAANQAARRMILLKIEDFAFREIPKSLKPYFNTDRYTRDQIADKGRGAFLADHDGKERSVKVNGRYFHIYRLR
jgi:hypothetical protein